MIKNWLKKCDFLNIQMSLSYKNANFYATNIGAILTIICFIIIISISSYEIKQLYNKSYFTIISNQYTDLSEKLDFEKTPLLFQLATSSGQLIENDEKLYELKAIDVEYSIEETENGQRKKSLHNRILELERCDKVLINNTEIFSNLNLSKYVCLKKGQNLTSYGLLGDSNNGFKGFRIYVNKCNGKINCYDNDVIVNKLKNSKFVVTYLSLNANIYNLDIQNLKYQLFSQSCSISTNILKKIYFSYNIGKFSLYEDIFYKKRYSFQYIIANNQNLDIDLDSSSTLENNDYTLAYISFHYSGNIMEVSKEVQSLFDSIALIGNIFNILLTLTKIINNYYANKILFGDIFENLFWNKEKHFHIRDNNMIKHFKNSKNYTLNRKKYLDISDDIGLNMNSCKMNGNKRLSKHIVINNKNNINGESNKKKSFLFLSSNKGKINKKHFIFFYIIPHWILKRNKAFNNLYLIKDNICAHFSVEKINELIKFKESMEAKEKLSKMSNTELIQINKNNNNNNINSENNSSNKNIK